MSFFPSLPGDAGLPRVLAFNPKGRRAVVSAYEAMLSTAPRLSAADKDLIAAYVAALNADLRGIPAASVARPPGVDAGVVQSLLDDFEATAPASALRPLLSFVRKLTLCPLRLAKADADAVFAEGWTERDLHDTALIAALYIYMNCIQDAHGVTGVPSLFDERGLALLDAAMPLKWLE